MQGCVQIYTGNGKGKTTASAGLALRAVGAGMRVFIGQFIKNKDSAEMKLLRERCPEVDIVQFGAGGFITSTPSGNDLEKAHNGIEHLRNALACDDYDMVIADEILGALSAGVVTLDEITTLIAERPSHLELIFTGRNAPQEIIEKADLVTEMNCIKHYYDKGVQARKGIEF